MSNVLTALAALASNTWVIRLHKESDFKVTRPRYRGKKRKGKLNRWTPKQKFPKARVRTLKVRR